MKKILAVLLTAMLALSFSVPAFAASVTKADYQTSYNDYKGYYDNTYVAAYHAYNQKLNELSAKIAATNFETVEQAQRVIDFLNGLKTAKNDFFGNRTTEGKSRYVVPALRDQMTAKASAGDYAAAIDACAQLKEAVTQRVNYLNGKAAQISSFQVIVPQQPAVTVQFTVTDYTQWWTNFKFVLTNNSDTAITNWSLVLNYTGNINYIGINSAGYNGFGTLCNSSGYNLSKASGQVTLKPGDIWQAGYTIPPHTSLTFIGNGASVNGISSASINGVNASVTFTK